MSTAAMMSPSDRMKLALQSAVSAGSVKSSDQSALSSALDDIDAAMKASGPPTAGTSPTAMKTKVDGLVDQEVTDGKLTADQATELKSVFAQAASKMGHHHGGPPPSDDSDDDSDNPLNLNAMSTTSGTSTADTTKAAIDQLMAFLQKLEQSVSSSSTYGSKGTSTASTSTSSSMLIDTLA
jgi:polyhydroxyalkanoate synthesis regulator phasin